MATPLDLRNRRREAQAGCWRPSKVWMTAWSPCNMRTPTHKLPACPALKRAVRLAVNTVNAALDEWAVSLHCGTSHVQLAHARETYKLIAERGAMTLSETIKFRVCHCPAAHHLPSAGCCWGRQAVCHRAHQCNSDAAAPTSAAAGSAGRYSRPAARCSSQAARAAGRCPGGPCGLPASAARGSGKPGRCGSEPAAVA